MQNSFSPRSKLISRLFEDLVGPKSESEELYSYPSDVYLTGILYPQKKDINEEDRDQLQAEGTGSADNNGNNDEEISLATVKKPASAGLSFAVKSSNTPQINISFSGAYYIQEVNDEDKRVWKRKEVKASINSLDLNFTSKELDNKLIKVEGLGIHIRTSNWGDNKLVTVAMVNKNELPDEYERASIEEITIFQTHLEVTCSRNTNFIPRPLGSSAVDEDSKMTRLIYRNAKEYAVGHTCSAEWDMDSEYKSVCTTWIPKNVVPAMSSEGDKEFKKLSEKGVLSAKWLSEAQQDELTTGLFKIIKAYKSWLKRQSKEAEDLSGNLKSQADKHFKISKEVISRIQASINLIQKDKEVYNAFRLANLAILVQWNWTNPEKESLTWRPFQIGFILMTLSSVALQESDERDIADLLWFPTGGGKTEAYLGLVAFILFYRRLKYGENGAGVSAFMRYTLRLLTIQQFQRATNLICACESIRKKKYTVPNFNQDLGFTEFSIGLWVGRDSTPNKLNQAEESLRDESSISRPDQLNVCPLHQDIPLKWSFNKNNNKVQARCNQKDCLWHNTDLPVYTVDETIYEAKPSLIIGTSDKFAQIARNKSTRSLFGNGTEYRTPDLIIQDELHLISGPLGTLAGIYEASIDKLCSNDGSIPKIIASTATIRQAKRQIKDLFNRRTQLFPPPVLDADNSGFSVVDKDAKGRLYLGITTAGRSAKFTLQAVSASFLQAVYSEILQEKFKDDYWTMVGYFNSLRELGGALVLMQDDVRSSIEEYAKRHQEVPRDVKSPMELTSRVSSAEIKEYLQHLNKNYTDENCQDIVLATNMISVGVDVPRLGSMIVNGQPKTISEYIQATSRVGRRKGGPGGLVITLYNNAKARDRSHYETFNTWHKALYRDVEASSVTPFSPRAREKALHSQLVILARHLIDDLNENVKKISKHDKEINSFIDYLLKRCSEINEEEIEGVSERLNEFHERWKRVSPLIERYWNDYSPNSSLLISAEKAAELKSKFGSYTGRATPTPNSLRNVEASTMFVLDEKVRETDL